MTEEIIKECEFYLPFSEDCNEILDDNGNEIYKCSRRQDCYYKQLKQAENTVNECHKYLAELEDKIDRLEQENKELKEKIIELSEEKGHLIVENNTLKESNQSLSMLGTDLASANEIVRKEFFRADKNKDMWREKADNYRSALEEIKNNFMCFRSCMIPFHVGDKDNLPHKMADSIQNYCESIINKINEVLTP